MKNSLKKTLSILITSFFIKTADIQIHPTQNYKSFETKYLKLNYVRLCAKLCFFSKNSFFFRLKYPIYLLVSSVDKKENQSLYVLFQFYKYLIFNSKNKQFFNLSFLKNYTKILIVYFSRPIIVIHSCITRKSSSGKGLEY